ncbi:related to Cell cycle control protein cwf5 [Ustilago bromivora]|uniref:Related to Cell cycle control protein cwf5 n=1 Tax=Ustilago bromivora TaxID=307758 RepID=A0A1K0FV45_9BASI|nr:related to Cell cycle control protein cwf5 [Ustilago bromivora]SYW77356.1 related to Cell cycle control protein cwf5 [Ustilago bromivora]
MAAWSAHGKLGSTISGAEEAETPILCEACLGPNPYIRMTKDSQGKICKVCTRPFTVFRWNPGAGSRFKKTEICTTCAKVKNVCQTCILDLQYGLPVQVRDAALGIESGGPTSDKNREYFAETMDKQLEGPTSLVGSSGSPAGRAGQELLRKAARKEIGYKRDRPQQYCSAFARGNCPRGESCPFKHGLPSEKHFAPQTAASTSTAPSSAATLPAPAAARIISKQSATGLPPPEDTSVISLFVSSLPESATETPLKEWFLSLTPQLHADHIKSITLVTASKCAFVNFRTRQQAELAAKHCSPKMKMGDKEVRLTWGRSRPAKKAAAPSKDS